VQGLLKSKAEGSAPPASPTPAAHDVLPALLRIRDELMAALAD
jgi:hypothetical protein